MPCSPGMTACKATCLHRAHIESYRAERARQQEDLYAKAGGYSTEITDLERKARENSPWRTPYVTLKQWLVQSRIPSEVRDMPEPAALREPDGPRFLQFENDIQANEAMLLATAMRGEPGVEALRVIGRDEFYYPEHQNIRQAILDLADQGLPHDAAAVTEELRNRPLLDAFPTDNPATQLPRHMDPTVPARTVDPSEWGLGAWETYGPPAALAPRFAADVRSAYRQRYLVDGFTRLTQQAKGSLTWDHTGAVDQDLLGMVREKAAYHLMDMPPMLDHNLKPVQNPDRDQSVTPWAQKVTRTSVAIADPMKDLKIPVPPTLSPATQQALSRSGR